MLKLMPSAVEHGYYRLVRPAQKAILHIVETAGDRQRMHAALRMQAANAILAANYCFLVGAMRQV